MGFKMAYFFTLMKIINHFMVVKQITQFFIIGKGLYFQVLGIFFLRKLQKKELFYIKILFVIIFYNGESQAFHRLRHEGLHIRQLLTILTLTKGNTEKYLTVQKKLL
jgi:hypothetical protein